MLTLLAFSIALLAGLVYADKVEDALMRRRKADAGARFMVAAMLPAIIITVTGLAVFRVLDHDEARDALKDAFAVVFKGQAA